MCIIVFEDEIVMVGTIPEEAYKTHAEGCLTIIDVTDSNHPKEYQGDGLWKSIDTLANGDED